MTGDEDTAAETEQTEDRAASENVELSESAADEEVGASTAAAELEEMEETVVDSETIAEETVRFVPMEVRNVQAQVENPEQAANVTEQATTEQMITPDKLTSSVQYANILENTDFVYQNHGYDVQESIVIKRQQNTYSYSFALNLNGLTPTLEADGSVLLVDADGAGIFEIPAPYLQDADGEVSFDAAYALTQTTDGYVLTVTADPAWLNAEERAFPVTLDPTVRLVANSYTSKLTFTYVNSGSPSEAHFGYQTMYIGKSGSNVLEAYMGVDNLPQIDSNCQIVGASVHLYQWNYSGYVDLPIYAYQVSTAKPSSYATYNTWMRNITWNNRPAHETTILDYQTAHVNGSGYISFDLTKAVQNWYIDTSLPCAIALASDGAHAANSQIYAYASQCAPILAIQYRNMIGLEDYYTYQSFGVGRAGTMYLSDHTNSLTIARTDVSLNLDPAPLYAKEDGTYERFFGLIAKITYTDNTTENHYVLFDASYSGWQYATGIIVPKQSNKTVSTVTVQCAYNKNANDAYFDGVSLIEEPVQTYSYDEKGNPIAATDADAGYSYAYTYDTAGNIRSAAAQAMKLHFLQKKLWNTWFQSFLLGAGRSGHFP